MATLSDFKPALAESLATEKRDLLITGSNGVGKTHLAAAVFNARVSDMGPGSVRGSTGEGHGFDRVGWITVPELLLRIRSTYNGRGTLSEKDVIDDYSGLHLLVLDDLGAEKVSDWSFSALYIILNRRIDYLRPTIVTTNMTLAALNDAEPRLASRLAGFLHVKLEGRDRRMATA
jgi:DNA replication protein DnaC